MRTCESGLRPRRAKTQLLFRPADCNNKKTRPVSRTQPHFRSNRKAAPKARHLAPHSVDVPRAGLLPEKRRHHELGGVHYTTSADRLSDCDPRFNQREVSLVFAAHLAAGLVIKAAQPKAPAWAVLTGAFLPDLFWIAFALAGF